MCRKILSIIMILLLLISSASCGAESLNYEVPEYNDSTIDTNNTEDISAPVLDNSEESSDDIETVEGEVDISVNNEIPEQEIDEQIIGDETQEKQIELIGESDTSFNLSDPQKSSIAMLNYITVLSKEINASTNSKLLLDTLYSDIVNNINPNAVDEDTMNEIRTILNTIYAYQSIETKRERQQYLYEQNQASALRNALPNPLSVLNVIQSGDPVKALISVVYMAVDAASSYNSYMSEVESKYMQEGWTLDDEAAANLHESRLEAFTYMVERCQKVGLPGELALNEKAVDDFVSWENKENITRRIEFLEDNVLTYQAYGKYWLVLADSYYEKGDYSKCLEAVERYEGLGINTFRKDIDLAKTLSVAIAAANEVYEDEVFIPLAEHYLSLMLSNINNEDWLLRYIAAQTYLSLYARTDDVTYLEKAFDLTETNVNYLVDVQHAKNREYLEEIKKVEKNNNMPKSKKDEIEAYNKMIEEERKVALPPVYQPLVLNCDLLFGLANELEISESDKSKIEEIIHYQGKPLFLVEPLDNLYHFSVKNDSNANISFDGKTIKIPAVLLEQGASIRLIVRHNNQNTIYRSWELEKVTRSDENNVSSFVAEYNNGAVKKKNFSDGDVVTIEIIPPEGSNYKTQRCVLTAKKVKKTIGSTIIFE